MIAIFGSTYACEKFLFPYEQQKDEKPITFDRRTLEIFYESDFRDKITEEKIPLPVQTTPSLQPSYTVAEVNFDQLLIR